MKRCKGFTLTELVVVIAIGGIFFALVFYLINHSYELNSELNSKTYVNLEEKTINNVFSNLTDKTNFTHSFYLFIYNNNENTVFRVLDSESNVVDELIVYEDSFIYNDLEYQLKEYKLNIVYNPKFNKYFIVEYYAEDELAHQEVFYVVRGIINE